ncbi:MAG: rhodanese-like domain-containing protein, partial [Ectothiorhodospiraceae bacterium]
ASNHWLLVLALVAVVVAIIVNEVLALTSGGKALGPESATQMYNRENAVFVDIRTENSYITAHLPGAVNIPLAHLDQQVDKLKSYDGRPLIVYCDHGRTSAKAESKLRKLGIQPVFQLRGGLSSWQSAGLPTESRG